MTAQLKQFRRRLMIDKFGLDTEVQQQPVRFFDVAEQCSEAAAIRDKAKKELADAESEAAGRIRKIYREDKKLTESRVKELIRTDKKYIRTYTEFLHAKREADRWDNLKEAYIQRASMLRHLVGLYLSNYYTADAISGDSNTREIGYQADRAALRDARHKRSTNRMRKQ